MSPRSKVELHGHRSGIQNPIGTGSAWESSVDTLAGIETQVLTVSHVLAQCIEMVLRRQSRAGEVPTSSAKTHDGPCLSQELSGIAAFPLPPVPDRSHASSPNRVKDSPPAPNPIARSGIQSLKKMSPGGLRHGSGKVKDENESVDKDHMSEDLPAFGSCEQESHGHGGPETGRARQISCSLIRLMPTTMPSRLDVQEDMK